jgi:hypothetical protein
MPVFLLKNDYLCVLISLFIKILKMNKTIIKGLSHNLDLLLSTFNIEVISEDSQLTEWLNVQNSLSVSDTIIIEKLYNQAKNEANHWNEEELKMRLVSILFLLSDMDVPKKVKIFYERPMKGIIENIEVSVLADCLIASPLAINTPQKPYFFLQEYKKGRGETKDPEAQMLAGMLIAQEKNQDGKPLFGSYLIGTDWYFTTLLGKNYASSREYDVRNYDDIIAIVAILRKLKELILQR